MSFEKDLVIFSICGQEFRIRAGKEEADRIERVAENVRDRIAANRQRGGTSDLRAALMAAYELAYEHEVLDQEVMRGKKNEKTIDTAQEAMDRLLRRLEDELARPVLETDPKPHITTPRKVEDADLEAEWDDEQDAADEDSGEGPAPTRPPKRAKSNEDGDPGQQQLDLIDETKR
jgi:cell division protein ZapA (FtsZ GTPase activity inhibitor)